eukprot:scaffold1739_cov109-Cylindrotheca_fusiformis.AAC.7
MQKRSRLGTVMKHSPRARTLHGCICLLVILVEIPLGHSASHALRAPATAVIIGSSRPVLDLFPEKSYPTKAARHDDEGTVRNPFGYIKLRLCSYWSNVWRGLFFRDKNGMRSDKRQKQPPANILHQVKQSLTNLWFGVSHVLQHYTLIWLFLKLGTEVVHAPLAFVLAVAADKYPSLYRKTRKQLVNFLIFLDSVAAPVDAALLELSALVFLYPLYGAWIPSRSESSPRSKSMCFMNKSFPDFSILHRVVAAPLIEEIQYRWVFHSCWLLGTTSIHRRRGPHYTKSAQQDSQMSHATETDKASLKQHLLVKVEPWVLSSSMLFGMAHIGNWMPLNRKFFFDEIAIFLRLVSRKDEHKYPMRFLRDQQVLASVYQSQHAFVASLICFAPLYQHRGVMAAIGSHATLNLINSCIPGRRYILAIGAGIYKLLQMSFLESTIETGSK